MRLAAESSERGTTAARTNIRHVARSAGVSMSSVSRVLSGHPDVSSNMRERVLLAVKELRYEPDFLAQSLRRGASRSIGLVIRDVANPPMAQLVHGAERALRRAGYSMMVMNSENDSSTEAEHIRLMQNRRADGLILSLAGDRHPATLEALAQVETPWIAIDCDLPPMPHANAVLFDHRAGTVAAIDHLLTLGHRRIALLTWPLDVRAARERLIGVRAAYEAHGLPDTSIPVVGLTSAAEAEAATETLLDEFDPPTAIVAGAHKLLIGSVSALRKRGLAPGIDIALVTCDDVLLAELYMPPIATISRDNMECGQVAGELLTRQINGDGGAETVVLPTHFVPRASCGGPLSSGRSTERV